MAGDLHTRFAETRLDEALADSPVVLVHGPRQCGYDGEVSASFGDGLFAIPIRALWETTV